MPTEVLKYTCDYKCGKPSASFRIIKAHESVCFKNPSRKTCSTCKHEIYEKDGCDHPEIPGCPSEKWMNRSCNKIPHDEFEKLWDACDF